jgi:hypothetical protein
VNSSAAPDLTILTVVVEKHYDKLLEHIKLMDRLNPAVAWHLVAVDNSGSARPRLAIDDPRVEVRPGVAPDQTKSADARSSYHHAAALNANLDGIRSRYLLVIDPDLFVVYPGWMRETMQHMHERKLSFFGVPWHPRWYTKYRGFPCVHFMMIDMQSVPASHLDFRPELLERPSWSRLRRESEAAPEAGPRRASWSLLDAIYRAFYPLLSRQLLGSSRDTGSKVWADFGRSSRYRAEIVVPVVDIENDFAEPKFLRAGWGRLLDRLMPPPLRFLPKTDAYVPSAEAKGFDAPEFRGFSSEQFMWRGRPFAFHLRGHMNADADSVERPAVAQALNRF